MEDDLLPSKVNQVCFSLAAAHDMVGNGESDRIGHPALIVRRRPAEEREEVPGGRPRRNPMAVEVPDRTKDDLDWIRIIGLKEDVGV